MEEGIRKKSFLTHHDIAVPIVEDLTDEQAGKLWRAIILFSADGLDPEFDDQVLKMAFKPFRAQLIREAEKYEKTVVRNREVGKLGGRPPKKSKLLTHEEVVKVLAQSPGLNMDRDFNKIVDNGKTFWQRK